MKDQTRSVGIFHAKTHLSELLRETARGRSILIRRRGKPVALLAPLPKPRGEELSDLLREFRRLRRRVGPGLSIRELIDEGRRF